MPKLFQLIVSIAAGACVGGLLAWKFKDRCAP